MIKITTKGQILKDIRKHCLNCCDGSWTEVRDCSALIPPTERHCVLYPYRMGKDPNPARKGQKVGFARSKDTVDGE